MRKMSKAAKAEAYDALKSERDAYAQLAHFLLNTRAAPGFGPDAVERIKDGDSVTEYRLYGCTRADGGTLAIVDFDPTRPHGRILDAVRFDEWWIRIQESPWRSSYSDSIGYKLKIVADRLERARLKVFAAAGATVTS